MNYPLAKLRWAAQDERDKRARMAAMKEEAERDLLAFVRMCWPIIEPETPLVEGWLMDMMCDVLMAISYGDLTRVCINVPPGSSKSTLLNCMLPAWEWGPCNRPSLRYLSLSYSTIVPVRDNLRFSQIIQHPVYRQCWGDRFAVTRSGSEWVGNNRTGWKAVTSVGGSTTGLRGDRLLCLPYQARLTTPGGDVAIGRLVEERLRLPVLAFDEKTNAPCWGGVVSWQINPPRRLFQIVTENGRRLIATEDHRIYTARGLIRMDQIAVGEIVTTISWRPLPDGVPVLPDVPGRTTLHRDNETHGGTTAGPALLRTVQPEGDDDAVRYGDPGGREGSDHGGNLGDRSDGAIPQSPGDGGNQSVSDVQALWPERDDRRQWRYRSKRRGRGTPPGPGESDARDSSLSRATQLGDESGVDAREEGDPGRDGTPEVARPRIPRQNAGSSATQPRGTGKALGCPVGRSGDAGSYEPVDGGENARIVERARVSGQVPGEALAQQSIVVAAGPVPVEVDRTYNIEIAIHHNYVADGVLVRNCDDLNNPKDVESDDVRKATTQFVREIMPDRLNDLERSAIINLQQRTHEGDATGVLLEHGQGYTFVCVPALFDPLRIFPVVLKRDEEGEPEETWVDPRSLDEDGKQLRGLTTNKRGEPELKPGSPMALAEGESFWPERFSVDTLLRLKAEKGAYAWSCNPGTAPLLMADLSMKRLDQAQIGDEIVGFETGCEPRRDGERWARRRLVRTRILDIHAKVRPVVRITLDSGRVIRCTADHKWFTGRTPDDKTHPLYAQAKVGRALLRVCNPDLPDLEGDDLRAAGWLAGFYEGEGSVCAQSRREGDTANAVISFAQGEKNLPICEELERVLTRLGFEWGVSMKRHADNPLRMYWLKRGGLPTYQRFLHIARPIKWRDRIIDAAYGSSFVRSEERVVSIEPDGEETVYGLTTGTGNYVVWGLASSNSQYDQFPGVRGGAIIRREWWRSWPGEYPAFGTVIASLDTAVEQGETNDFNAVTVWGAFAGEKGEPLLLMIAAWKMRATLAELVTRVAETCRERKVDYLLIEHKTRGRDVHDEIRRLYGAKSWETVLIKPEGDKESRLRAVSRLFSGDYRRLPDGGKDTAGRDTYVEVWSGGIVHAPDRDFADEVIAEVASFPYGDHDDYTDTVSQALGWVRRNGVVLHADEFEEQEMARNKFRRDPGVPYAIRRSR